MSRASVREITAAGTPDDVHVSLEPREREWAPGGGVPGAGAEGPVPPHRLVAIGDSLTHGFQSGAIFNTDLSWPAIVARELGWHGYRYPRYGGTGRVPLESQ